MGGMLMPRGSTGALCYQHPPSAVSHGGVFGVSGWGGVPVGSWDLFGLSSELLHLCLQHVIPRDHEMPPKKPLTELTGGP